MNHIFYVSPDGECFLAVQGGGGGGGESSSTTKTETDQSTTITTNTTSNLSDLHLDQGFTGDDAVRFVEAVGESISQTINNLRPALDRTFDIAELMGQGVIESNKTSTQLISRIHDDSQERINPKPNLTLILAGAGVIYATYKLVN